VPKKKQSTKKKPEAMSLLSGLKHAIKSAGQEPWTLRGGGKLRMSATGYNARRHAFELVRASKSPFEARSAVTLAVGHLMHDWLREQINKSERFTSVEQETTLALPFFPDLVFPVYNCDGEKVGERTGVDVYGHCDGILHDAETDKRYLYDIKTMGRNGWIDHDPGNDKEGWFARHAPTVKERYYTFDAVEQWGEDPFNSNYIYQMCSYAEAAARKGLEFDSKFFMGANKNMGYINVGMVNLNDQEMEEWCDERDEEMRCAYETVAVVGSEGTPLDIEPCWGPLIKGQEAQLQCRYCPYGHHCLEWSKEYPGKNYKKVTKVYKVYDPNRPSPLVRGHSPDG
jgi:hypothetical protein